MAFVHTERQRAPRATISDRVQYNVIVAIIFTFCLASTATKRAAAAVVNSDNTQQERLSIIAEAKSVAHTAAGYAFKR